MESADNRLDRQTITMQKWLTVLLIIILVLDLYSMFTATNTVQEVKESQPPPRQEVQNSSNISLFEIQTGFAVYKVQPSTPFPCPLLSHKTLCLIEDQIQQDDPTNQLFRILVLCIPVCEGKCNSIHTSECLD